MLVEDLARNAGYGKQTDLNLLDFSKTRLTTQNLYGNCTTMEYDPMY